MNAPARRGDANRPGSRARVAAGRTAALVVGACLLAPAALGADRHAGYYYPLPATSEVYVSRAARLPETDRTRRIVFVTELMQQMMANPYPPPVAIFAKGAEGEKLIVTSLHAGAYDTIYRMRAMIAMLTTWARRTPIFRAYEVEDLFTFLDLIKLLGFEQLTVTDGDRFAHQFTIE